MSKVVLMEFNGDAQTQRVYTDETTIKGKVVIAFDPASDFRKVVTKEKFAQMVKEAELVAKANPK